MTSRKDPQGEKKAYAAPELIKYGTIAGLTQRGKRSGPGDFFWLLQTTADAGPEWHQSIS